MAAWGPGGAAGPGSWPPAPDLRGCGRTWDWAPGDPCPGPAGPAAAPTPPWGSRPRAPPRAPLPLLGRDGRFGGLRYPSAARMLTWNEAETSVPAGVRLCTWHRRTQRAPLPAPAELPVPLPGPWPRRQPPAPRPARVAHGPAPLAPPGALPGGLTAATFGGKRAGGPVRGIGIKPVP